jgi:predicted nucleic acid-binding protein
VNVYLDASVLVALFVADVWAVRIESVLRARSPVLLVSDFAAAEFASAISRHVRTGSMEAETARRVFVTFDAWTARAAQRAITTSADVAVAAAFLRRLDLPLRTPDALNIAIAQRVATALMTFDEKIAASAKALGMSVVSV